MILRLKYDLRSVGNVMFPEGEFASTFARYNYLFMILKGQFNGFGVIMIS
jgi:hypothetical protein